MVQQSYEDVVGKSIFQAWPKVRDYGLIDVFQRIIKTGNHEHYPAKLYADGKLQRWFENFVYQLPTGEIVAVYNDVTENKKAEEEINKSRERLQILHKILRHDMANNFAVIKSAIGIYKKNLTIICSQKLKIGLMEA